MYRTNMSDTDGRTEACGRCAMSTVVDAVDGEEDRDPFATRGSKSTRRRFDACHRRVSSPTRSAG